MYIADFYRTGTPPTMAELASPEAVFASDFGKAVLRDAETLLGQVNQGLITVDAAEEQLARDIVTTSETFHQPIPYSLAKSISHIAIDMAEKAMPAPAETTVQKDPPPAPPAPNPARTQFTETLSKASELGKVTGNQVSSFQQRAGDATDSELEDLTEELVALINGPRR